MCLSRENRADGNLDSFSLRYKNPLANEEAFVINKRAKRNPYILMLHFKALDQSHRVSHSDLRPDSHLFFLNQSYSDGLTMRKKSYPTVSYWDETNWGGKSAWKENRKRSCVSSSLKYKHALAAEGWPLFLKGSGFNPTFIKVDVNSSVSQRCVHAS